MFRTSETIDKLMPELLAARRDIKPAEKGGKNAYDDYTYAKEADWHSAVMPSLLEHDLFLAFSVAETINLEPRTTKNGGIEYAVQVNGSARITHGSGQWFQVDGVGQGQERSDKGAYQAMTGLKKYLYALLFALPTTDDPEKDNPPPAPKRELTEGEKIAWYQRAIAKACEEKDVARLNKLGTELPTKGFPADIQQMLSEKASEALMSLEP